MKIDKSPRLCYNINMKILMKNKDTNKVLMTFDSYSQAALYLGKADGASNIRKAATGVRKSAYKYKWELVDEDSQPVQHRGGCSWSGNRNI